MTKLPRLSPTRTISLIYCAMIAAGTLLLLLPAASRDGETTGFLDALFTATSALCVTGLIRFDTYTHWSLFGQIAILLMIQVGGIGFMTIAITFITMIRRKIGIGKRIMMQESIAAPQMGGIVKMTRFILIGTLILEAVGAILLAFYFCPRFGLWQGVYFGIFHSISAFCNAGFDLMGVSMANSSLTTAADNIVVNLVIIALIVIGGLGFFVWMDLWNNRFRLRKCRLHTKIVVAGTLMLIVSGALLIFLFEQQGELFQGKSVIYKVLTALFQSVTPRTAGFNTLDLGRMTQMSQVVMITLMFAGGSPGSTAGGMKVTTTAVLFLSVFSTFRHRRGIECFKRRIEDEVVRTAVCVMVIYLTLSVGTALIIAAVEQVPFLTAMFETTSALCTVGSTLGITTQAGILSQLLLVLLMVVGRVGSLTILLTFASETQAYRSSIPQRKYK